MADLRIMIERRCRAFKVCRKIMMWKRRQRRSRRPTLAFRNLDVEMGWSTGISRSFQAYRYTVWVSYHRSEATPCVFTLLIPMISEFL
jgi:hypothetical protein